MRCIARRRSSVGRCGAPRRSSIARNTHKPRCADGHRKTADLQHAVQHCGGQRKQETARIGQRDAWDGCPDVGRNNLRRRMASLYTRLRLLAEQLREQAASSNASGVRSRQLVRALCRE